MKSKEERMVDDKYIQIAELIATEYFKKKRKLEDAENSMTFDEFIRIKKPGTIIKHDIDEDVDEKIVEIKWDKKKSQCNTCKFEIYYTQEVEGDRNKLYVRDCFNQKKTGSILDISKVNIKPITNCKYWKQK